jgi:PAS domain S-box-containing protein
VHRQGQGADTESEKAGSAWARLRAVLDTFPEATNAYDREWRFTYINPAAAESLRAMGRDPGSLIGRVVWEEFPSLVGTRFELEARRAVTERRVIDFEDHLLEPERWIETRIVPMPDGALTYSRDITRRKLFEARLREHNRLTSLAADVSATVAQGGSLHEMLQRAAESVVRGLDAAFARIWTLDAREQMLHLQASAGIYTNLHGRYSRIPVGALKIGEIAASRQPHLTNDVINDPRVSDPDWARREGMVSFAGYPLVIDDRLVGVLALFARHTLSDSIIRALSSVAHTLSIGIKRAMTEIALREEESRYRALAESTAQFVWTTDPQGAVMEGSAAWEALTGQTPAEVQARGWTDAVHPADRPLTFQRWDNALASRSQYEATFRLRLVGGGYRRFRARGVPIFDENGAVREWVGVCIDVEDELRAEERRAVLERASQILAESLDVSSTLQSITELAIPELADVCIAYLEAGAQALSRAAIAIRPERSDIAHALQALPQLDLSHVPELRMVRTGRALLIHELTDDLLVRIAEDAEHLRIIQSLEARSALAVPLIARGRLLGFLLFLRSESGRRYEPDDLAAAEELGRRTALAVSNAQLFDQSEWARAEAVAANQAKSQFLATMSHELRTPLNAISGYAALIQDGVYGPVTERQHVALERLRRSQHHLLRLVEGVLDYARMEAHVVSYEITNVKLDEALAYADALVAPQLGANGIHFTCDFAACGYTVRADREKLDQILLNLLSNAIKFTDRDGRITVTCAAREHEIAIHVKDTGMGIPAASIEAIFLPFVQVRGGLTRTSHGAGLGLSISRDLARGMGGDITVESVEGLGSTFTLTLPRAY